MTSNISMIFNSWKPSYSSEDHYSDLIMSTMASQITGVTIVYLTIFSGADQRKHQSSASLAFVGGIHCWPVNSLHKGPVTRKMFPIDCVIMKRWNAGGNWGIRNHQPWFSMPPASHKVGYYFIHLSADLFWKKLYSLIPGRHEAVFQMYNFQTLPGDQNIGTFPVKLTVIDLNRIPLELIDDRSTSGNKPWPEPMLTKLYFTIP